TYITDIKDKKKFKEYKSVPFNLKIDINDFSVFFGDLKSCNCTTAVIKAYETFMKITGRIEKKEESSEEFGNKRVNYKVEGEDNNYFPIKYVLDNKEILILSKLNTISS